MWWSTSTRCIPPRELKHQLKDSGARAIVILENFASTLEEVIDHTDVQHVVLAAMGDLMPILKGQLVNFAGRHLKKMVPEFRLPLDSGRTVTRFNWAVAEGTRLTLKRPALGPDDVAFLQYTGGTTGVSKGATLLHRNVVANILQTEAWFKPVLDQVGDRQLTVVCALPLYHIFALTICYMMGARLGMLNLLIPNPRDLPGFVKALQGRRVNMFPAVNTLFNALAHDPDFARLDFSGLVVSNGGGMAVQQATAENGARSPDAASSRVTACRKPPRLPRQSPGHCTASPGSIGMPVPSTDIAIRDDDGRHVPIGGAGEICIRGPQVMAGYWNRPDETAKVMAPDGFFKHRRCRHHGRARQVRIVDRKKDMILVSGFNVYPTRSNKW
jgi:long-chain acyl-CoA synthetase